VKYEPIYKIQGNWEMRRWSNPSRDFHFLASKINFEYEADPYPGILILTNLSHNRATVLEVKNLRQELSAILAPFEEDTVAYWKIVRDDVERGKIVVGLTKTPVYNDRSA
jgi:hypothetical protein